jgi:predicted RNA-binding Zn ribbon-like protein
VLVAKEFEFSGGALCLDFVNTLSDRPVRRKEGLCSYGDLVEWGRQAGILTGEEARGLAAAVRRGPGAAGAALARAIALREALFRLFSAIAAGRHAGAGDVAAINDSLPRALSRLRVRSSRGAFHWRFEAGDRDLDRVLWPVVRSAAELLTSPELPRLRECASGSCSWIFVDRSRTHRRRWCDMKTCGNRAKARRHYRRRRRGGAPAGGRRVRGG